MTYRSHREQALDEVREHVRLTSGTSSVARIAAEHGEETSADWLTVIDIGHDLAQIDLRRALYRRVPHLKGLILEARDIAKRIELDMRYELMRDELVVDAPEIGTVDA